MMFEGDIASVALDMMLVGSQGPGKNGGQTGRGDGLSDDYRILADFDSGAVRLWQVRYWMRQSARCGEMGR